MGKFTKEMKKILLKIEKQRAILSYSLITNEITEENILSLVNVDSNFGIRREEISDYKIEILKGIYNSPFLLCDQEFLGINAKKILPALLKYRYNMELEELNYYYELGHYTKEEYEKQKSVINFMFFRSSQDGKDILKNGQVRDVVDNVIRYK